MDTLLLMKKNKAPQCSDSRRTYVEARADLISLSQADILTGSGPLPDADEWTPWY